MRQSWGGVDSLQFPVEIGTIGPPENRARRKRMTATMGSNGNYGSDQWRVKVGLAEMLKGGVIMDVTNAEQARIAEDAGACAVMALERVPSDIRKEGGVARMA